MDKMNNISELPLNKYTEQLCDEICFGKPLDANCAEDVIDGINRAAEIENHPAFLEGLSERLTQLGVECGVHDTDIMLSEVKKRYKAVLGIPCPRTVQEWIRGTVPGVTNRLNNYSLCYALEMDLQQTAVFFQKHFLTLPFNCKARVDAVFLYCLCRKKPYSAAKNMLENSCGFVSQENAHTATSQIFRTITETENDDKFMEYLSAHCYGNEQQFQLARSIIKREIDAVKSNIRRYNADEIISPDRLNSLTVAELLGYRYQSREPKIAGKTKLPKHFAESLPNDVTLGRIINGESVSYEVLRKTLMLLRFYNFYSEAGNTCQNEICENLMDFFDELNGTLISCGFAQIYIRHPFDCLLLYCANSYDPIVTLHCVNEYGRN